MATNPFIPRQTISSQRWFHRDRAEPLTGRPPGPHPKVGVHTGDAALDEARDERSGAELWVLDQLRVHERDVVAPLAQ
jgi:hypothetical protein